MADIVTSRIFTDGERGITAQKLNDIVGSSVIQPAFYTSKPTAGTADPADIALILKAGAYAQVPISTLAGSATQAQIWSTRLRSYNSVGNPNFEVDQRNCFGGLLNPGVNTFLIDRWFLGKSGGTWTGNFDTPASAIVVPGTNFWISKNCLRFILQTTQASLAAGDTMCITQHVEGSATRELLGDVTSLSLLVFSNVANLKFSVVIRDNPPTKSLVKLCTIPVASQWTLIQLPNLPLMPSGNFTWNPGAIGYDLSICLASGSTFTAPAADVWQSGNFVGAPGMSNFMSNPVNSAFYFTMVQHEPGALCTTFIDKPFAGANGNLEECQRYYQKTYDNATAVGTVTISGVRSLLAYIASTSGFGAVSFSKLMAKTPAVTAYNHNTGAINSIFDQAGVSHPVTAVNGINTTGFYGLSFTTATSAILPIFLHYTADTGW